MSALPVLGHPLCYTPRTSTKIQCRGEDSSCRQLYGYPGAPQWSKEDRWTTDLHNFLTSLTTYLHPSVEHLQRANLASCHRLTYFPTALASVATPLPLLSF